MRRALAVACSGLGWGAAIAGIGLIYPPASLIAAGVTLAVFGFLLIDVGGSR
jgi:hypothetical protein